MFTNNWLPGDWDRGVYRFVTDKRLFTGAQEHVYRRYQKIESKRNNTSRKCSLNSAKVHNQNSTSVSTTSIYGLALWQCAIDHHETPKVLKSWLGLKLDPLNPCPRTIQFVTFNPSRQNAILYKATLAIHSASIAVYERTLSAPNKIKTWSTNYLSCTRLKHEQSNKQINLKTNYQEIHLTCTWEISCIQAVLLHWNKYVS